MQINFVLNLMRQHFHSFNACGKGCAYPFKDFKDTLHSSLCCKSFFAALSCKTGYNDKKRSRKCASHSAGSFYVYMNPPQSLKKGNSATSGRAYQGTRLWRHCPLSLPSPAPRRAGNDPSSSSPATRFSTRPLLRKSVAFLLRRRAVGASCCAPKPPKSPRPPSTSDSASLFKLCRTGCSG